MGSCGVRMYSKRKDNDTRVWGVALENQRELKKLICH